ncbi:MAG: hypothetical protein J2P26_02440 [Nocardiopsaceae bacterium]|nr:hypothetical protein [Nocardiopsaceae bacterium]
MLITGAGYIASKGIYKVPPGKIGVQIRHFSHRHPNEYDPRVSVLGSPGPQAEVLLGNGYYFRTPLRYEIKYVDHTYIEAGTIGLVSARAGRLAPPEARLAPFVKCDSFQDGTSFLRHGGCQGLQMQVLTNGYYNLNPVLFDVITAGNVDRHPALGLRPEDLYVTEIKVGETGVVITHLGQSGTPDQPEIAPRLPGHNQFQNPWSFLGGGGQLGVQSETLPEGGHYAINPLFAHVVKIPTRNLVLEWSDTPKKESNLDASLKQIELDVQGYTVRLNMTQTLRIPEEAAPGLVRVFGDQGTRGVADRRTPVQQFVEKELAAIVSAYFRRISARSTILEFITRYDEIGNELAQEVRDALAVRGIEAVATSLEEFTCQPDDMDELRRAIALERHRPNEVEAQIATNQLEIDLERQKLDLEKQKIEVDASRKLAEIQGLVKLLGPAQVATERILAEWAKMGIPHTIAVGGDDTVASSVLRAMPFSQAHDMLLALAAESGKHLGRIAPEGQQAIDDPDQDHQIADASQPAAGAVDGQAGNGQHNGQAGNGRRDEQADHGRHNGRSAGRHNGRPGKASDGEPPALYIVGRLPHRAPVARRIALVVQVAQGQPEDGPVPVRLPGMLPEGRDITVNVTAPGLLPLGDLDLDLYVPTESDSEPVWFGFETTQAGLHPVTARAFAGGTFLGELTLEVSVGAGAGMEEGRARSAPLKGLPATIA